ncbi:MAG: hypothetical protein N2749_00530 [Clostridia bacterium]|nr:hypothetical protein [Clostridia bacterium]
MGAEIIKRDGKIYLKEGDYECEYNPPQQVKQEQITLEDLNNKIDDLTLLILAQQGVIEL